MWKIKTYSCFKTPTFHQLCLAVWNMKCVLHGQHVMHKLTRVDIYHSLFCEWKHTSYLIANNPRSFLGKRSTKNNLECCGFLNISRRVLKGTNWKWSLKCLGFLWIRTFSLNFILISHYRQILEILRKASLGQFIIMKTCYKTSA